ncbi:phosphoenolpyruvate synthase [Candidatus Woesearchaeota archaeon]|nr:phosphoenolpyruvate synthase [Candidatus Woesearchaeota archaeon]
MPSSKQAKKRIFWFKEIAKDDIPIAGGKGANLGEMFRLGLPVPSGFIVSAQTYKEFIDRTGLYDKIKSTLVQITDYENNDLLQAKSNEVQQLIMSAQMPDDIATDIKNSYNEIKLQGDISVMTLRQSVDPFVAVRSSATAEDLPQASFAGQQATFLNVRGDNEVVQATRACWASLFTARATYYRMKNKFDHMQVLICVVVQRMVNSEASGIMFSANPVSNNLDEVVIEAGYGLGEAIVSGAVNPNLYIVDKDTMKITKIEVKKQLWGLFLDPRTGQNVKNNITPEMQSKQILSEQQILTLATLAKRIEDHYGKPQDIEWAMENKKIFIVQSRAITTIKKLAEKKSQASDPFLSAKIILHGDSASPGVASGGVVIVHDPSELGKIKKGDVLVTTMTTPDMVPAMERAAAIVTDEGGMTCHAAIVSREMGIPCIVGTETATTTLSDGLMITVHATRGIVYEGVITPPQEAVTAYVPTKEEHIAREEELTATQVKVVMDLPTHAEQAAATGADGVGLVRLEIMIAMNGVHPAEYIRQNNDDEYTQMLVTNIEKIATAFRGKPVWVRTSDLRSDEYRNLKGGDHEPHETDPMIGWHGIRRCLDEPRILRAEFKAIKQLREQGHTNVGIMIPFVIRASEVAHAKEIMREVGMEPCVDVEFGVMCETPASCWIMEDICKEKVSFVSFGTNDLTQMTLGLDRNNARVSKHFDEMHPAVLGEIAQVISVCKKYGVTTSICGQAGSRPEMAEFLVKQGIDSISANPDAVHTIRQVVARVEKKLILEAERRRP